MNQQYHFLQGGGKTGVSIRQYNWAETSVGNPEQWPVSLRTTIGTMLSSKLAMCLWWGNDMIFFCNDAFSQCFYKNGAIIDWGNKDPAMLTKNPVYNQILIKEVLSGATSINKIVVVQNDNATAHHFDCGYCQVYDDADTIKGVLAICHEFIGPADQLQQIAESKEQLEFAVEAAELGVWELNPITGAFTANTRLKSWFGLQTEDEIPLALAVNVMDEGDRKRVADAIQYAMQYESGGRYDIEYTIAVPDSGIRRFVRAKGRARFGEDHIAYRFNGTLQDITAEKEAQREIANARSLKDLAIRGSGIGIFNINVSTGQMEYTPEFAAILTGDANKTGLNRQEFVNRIHPDDDQLRVNAQKTVNETGAFDYEPRIIWDDGSVRFVRIMGTSLQDEAGNLKIFSGTVQDITEQQITKQKLEAEEKRFRSLIEEATVATCLFVGRNLRIEVANERMLDFWGKDSSIIGMPLEDAVPILKGQPFLDILDQVFTSGVAYEAKNSPAELEINGITSTYYFDFTYKPLFNEHGEVYGIMDMAVDVTEQVLSRRKLEESEQFSRTVFYNSPVAKMVYIGDNMVVKQANEKMLELFGRGDSIIGKPMLDAVPELRGTQLAENYIKALTLGETQNGTEERIELIKDGQPYMGYYSYAYKALQDVNGTIYGVICTAIEVTRRVEAMQKLQQAEANMRGAVELAQLGTWNIEAGSGLFTASERLQFWFGFGKDEDIYNTGYNPIHKKDWQKVLAKIQEALRPGSDGVYDDEYTVVDYKTGRERILHSQGRVLLDDMGMPLRLTGTIQDVTVQRQLQLALENQVQERTEELAASNEELQAINEELAESNDALIRSNEELAQYAYVASHDLQEPLRKIQIFAGILDNNRQLPDSMKPSVKKIASSAQRMTLLIRDLLDFSRLLKSDSLMQPVDLFQVAQSIATDFELVVAEKNATINIQAMPVIQSISLQMNQLFYNLVGNALKFSKPEVPLVIEIKSTPIDPVMAKQWISKPLPNVQYYDITVTDNGIGFENQYAEQIFEVFRRLHGREIYPGSGIGLALCRRIVANHNGVLFADSEVGKGSVFHVVLPEKQ